MIKRFGDACYWIGMMPAGLVCLVIIGDGGVSTTRAGVFLGLLGGIPFAIGWITRYVATGRTDISPAPTPTE